MRPEHHEPGWSLRLTAKNPTSQPDHAFKALALRSMDHIGLRLAPILLAPIRSSVIVFVRDDVVPHIAARETHQRP
jgi:hypothetical protein